MTASWTGSVSTDFAANDDVVSPRSPSRDQRGRAERRAHQFTAVLLPVVFAIFIFGVSGLAIWLRSGNEIVKQPIAQIEKSTPAATKPMIAASPVTTWSEVSQTLATAHRKAALVEAELAYARLDVEFENFGQVLNGLLYGDVGNHIAASDDLFARFVSVTKIPGPDSKMPIESDLNKYRNSMSVATDIAFKQAVEFFVLKVGKWAAFIEHRRGELLSLQEEARRLPSGDESLVDALSRTELRMAKSTPVAVRAAASERESQNSYLKDLLANVEVERRNAKELASQLENIRRGEPRGAQTDGNASAPVASRAEYNSAMKHFRTLLQPFTTYGYAQPKSATEFVYEQSKLPMSLSRMVRAGALKDDDNSGIKILFFLGGSKTATQGNDRPLGAFPRMNSLTELEEKPDVEKRVREAQRFLRTYGRLMVEDEILSP